MSQSSFRFCFRYPKEMTALDENEHEEVDGQVTIPVPDHHVTGSKTATGASAARKKVETKDASNGVRMFCKHCGHPVDLDD